MGDTPLALFDLTGRVAVVTGGVGILGRAFCQTLAGAGAKVAVVDLDQEQASALAQAIQEEFGPQAAGYGCDIADSEAVARLADQIEAELGPVDILLNNAASKGPSLDAFFAPIESFDPAVWRSIMAVNLDGMFYMARTFGSRMAERRRGSIIQTASIYGLLAPDQRIYEGSDYLGRPINTPAIYSASKAGVIGLTRYLASYWGAAGVRVNTLTPGGVESGQNATFQARYGARVPLGRMAQIQEMQGAVLFLASDASSYVTGHNLVVDGGLSAW